MCGIVGYVGSNNAVPILIEGLRRLEYRGYDSAGIAFYEDGNMVLKKTVGKLANLESVLRERKYESHLGIGHTRWATHGRPTEVNSHPHSDCHGNLMVVHNGIIENYSLLKKVLISEGHIFRSQTDTEVIAHLIERYLNNGNLSEAVRRALGEVEGTYAIAVISSSNPDTIVAARKGSPIIIGRGDKEYILASDVPAILNITKDAIFVNDNELVVIREDGTQITDLETGASREESIYQIPWDTALAEKGGYAHFMLKEIHEQPRAVKNTFSGRINVSKDKVHWEELGFTAEELRRISRIYIVSCGTSWHASLVGKSMIEAFARVPVEVDLASEFRYRPQLIGDDTLTIGITQSGETADTLGAIRKAKEEGSKVLIICNVVGSTATREADGVIYTHAGPEIGVASTKAFTSQLVALCLFAGYLGRARELISYSAFSQILTELASIPDKIESILEKEDEIKRLAELYWEKRDYFFLGRGIVYPIALEGALKLKEISYLHAEGYAGGEMKHGPIALVDKDMVVVALIPHNSVYEKMLGNIEEVKARDASVIAITDDECEEMIEKADHVFYVPKTADFLRPVLFAIPLQLFAYYIARNRGCDIDQPRNLAKSVTVE
ncbi:MAG: glutamine--fructose-6-phosphate transaminase (isomerizing) [Thermodesulfobacteriota bacterium]